MFPSSGHGLGPGGSGWAGLRKKREKKEERRARSAINASEDIIPVRRLPPQRVNPPGLYERWQPVGQKPHSITIGILRQTVSSCPFFDARSATNSSSITSTTRAPNAFSGSSCVPSPATPVPAHTDSLSPLKEELEVPYEIKFYQRNSKTLLAPKELLNINPLGKAPVITDGDVTLAESGAIIRAHLC